MGGFLCQKAARECKILKKWIDRTTKCLLKLKNCLCGDGKGGKNNEEKRALNRYVSSESYKLNEKLCTRSPLTDEEERFVFSLDKALDKIPDYQGTVYRNFTLDIVNVDEFDSFASLHSVGNSVAYDGYTSTSKDQEGYTIDGDKIVSITMKVKAWERYQPFWLWCPEEQEVLLKRGTELKILKSRRDGNKIFFTMEEI
ncbi:MAG: ADP-ribosyltransferase [bacterium]|nr:ADP-ribosyltransferase [bacterium]